MKTLNNNTKTAEDFLMEIYDRDYRSNYKEQIPKECYIKAVKEFAKHILEEAAENAKTEGNCSIWNCEGESINKKSITDTLNKYL